MFQATPPHRVASLVITDDARPSKHLSEYLNNLTEDEERAQLAFYRSPEFALYVACREVELNLGDEELTP